MIHSPHLLTLTLFAPLLFATGVALLPSSEKGQIRAITLVGMLVSLGLALALYLGFDPRGSEFQFESRIPWIPSLGISYHVGVDGLAVSLILLTAVLGPILVLASWKAIDERVKELALALLVLQTAMVGTFAALDLVLFYVFWETMLVPMYLLIGVWGSENRIYAAVKFFLYTFAGSVLMLLAILYLYFAGGKAGAEASRTFDYVALLNGAKLPLATQMVLFGAFALAFAVKVPMFPLHTWLPDAHVQAPAAGSIVLAGVLLKMGSFGFMRYAFPLFPDAAVYFRPLVAGLAVVGIVYGSLMCMAQRDLKKLVAYSSVAHMGFVMLGIAALTVSASTGAVYQMLNHGVSTGALFLIVGMLYERRHSRLIADFGGAAKTAPALAAVFLLVILSSIGLPGTNGFIGEFLILSGTFTSSGAMDRAVPGAQALNAPWLATFAATGVVLGAVYMLTMYQRVMLGPARDQDGHGMPDLSLREWAAALPFVGLVLVMGIMPQPFLDRIAPSVQNFVARVGQGQKIPVPLLQAMPVMPAENVAAAPAAARGEARLPAALLEERRFMKVQRLALPKPPEPAKAGAVPASPAEGG